ncbi:MAG: hypothetical protein HY917_03835 [Candidatus Diapherotrites archaeon]|nr:hypothetical protein [Candidatus Diapherotrites archaeon]
METVTILKSEYTGLKRDSQLLRKNTVYKRLLEFEKSISAGKKFYRKDLGF